MARLGISLGLIVALLTACTPTNQNSSARVEEPYAPSSGSPYGSDPAYTARSGGYDSPDAGYASLDSMERAPAQYGATPMDDSAYTSTSADETLAPSGGRTYVVSKGDTFYKLARDFYSNQSRWRDIWAANKARVPNPDFLPVGTKLIIP